MLYEVITEEDVALLDHAALGEDPLLQEALHPGADLHGLLGVGAAGEFGVDRRVAPSSPVRPSSLNARSLRRSTSDGPRNNFV